MPWNFGTKIGLKLPWNEKQISLEKHRLVGVVTIEDLNKKFDRNTYANDYPRTSSTRSAIGAIDLMDSICSRDEEDTLFL